MALYHPIPNALPTLPRNLYVLSAVCDLKRIFALGLKLAKSGAKKEGNAASAPLGELPPWELDQMKRANAMPDSKEIRKCLRKTEFYLSWANEHGHEYDVLR